MCMTSSCSLTENELPCLEERIARCPKVVNTYEQRKNNSNRQQRGRDIQNLKRIRCGWSDERKGTVSDLYYLLFLFVH